MRKSLLVFALLSLSAAWSVAAAQDTLPATLAARVRIFLDCTDFFCDLDYYRREIAFVDYVRDRKDAQVHLLVTEQNTGGGGEAYVANFIGLREFAGRSDTLQYFAPQAATDDETRTGLARIFKLGLIPYVAATPEADRITISYQAPADSATALLQQADPWNYWVFRVNGQTFLSGESSYRNVELFGGVSARRTTDAWKLGIALDGSYSRDEFELDSVTTITSNQERYGVEAFGVKSLGPHWGARAAGSANRSTYSNQKLGLRAAVGAEYNIYPYDESARRLLTVRYELGASRYNYDEETIFGVTSETALDHSMEVELEVVQPWGETDLSLRGRQYLDDLSKSSLRLSGGVSVRLVKGLSLRLNGSISRVRDQRYLPAGGLTPEEILLRQRDVATDYRYRVSTGFSYSFGSIYNNFVNPRFGDGGGEIFFF